jgi:hypothetical protein
VKKLLIGLMTKCLMILLSTFSLSTVAQETSLVDAYEIDWNSNFVCKQAWANHEFAIGNRKAYGKRSFSHSFGNYSSLKNDCSSDQFKVYCTEPIKLSFSREMLVDVQIKNDATIQRYLFMEFAEEKIFYDGSKGTNTWFCQQYPKVHPKFNRYF